MTTFGMISTYPPTRCDLAGFAENLRTALLTEHADEVRVVRVGEAPDHGDAPEVVASVADGALDAENAAAALNDCDLALIQHDLDAYGGAEGRDVLAVADLLRVPSIAVLHTVPAQPGPQPREVLEGLMERADAIAVLSEAAADRLLTGYAVDAAKIAVIPAAEPAESAEPASAARPPASASDWTAVAAGYGRLASLLRAGQAQLLV
jgi:hypothetical protein